jgi:hypothetical protein
MRSENRLSFYLAEPSAISVQLSLTRLLRLHALGSYRRSLPEFYQSPSKPVRGSQYPPELFRAH